MFNQLKTIILLGALTGILLWIGSFWGQTGLTIAIIFAVLMNFGSYFWSDKIVLSMYKAQPADKHKYHELHQMVTSLAREGNIPKPQVYIVPSENPNAFATGRDPKHGVVAVTTGIMSLLSQEELKGVLAHEISHIKNRDILIQTVAATIAGVISYIATMAQWAALFGGFGGRDDEGGQGIIELLVLIILTPLLATLIQLAISRSREFMADQGGAKLMHSGKYLASALQKLEKGSAQHPMRQGNPSSAHMFIINPFKGGLMNLFMTHPPVSERVKKLEAI
ncbi:zinc metalloprotease HtpX [Candidatus Woesearchaeota archaeon]|nr:zinc metalloprotease HtpX [Candidatus Woesearchaeota archaeon]